MALAAIKKFRLHNQLEDENDESDPAPYTSDEDETDLSEAEEIEAEIEKEQEVEVDQRLRLGFNQQPPHGLRTGIFPAYSVILVELAPEPFSVMSRHCGAKEQSQAIDVFGRWEEKPRNVHLPVKDRKPTG